MTLKKLFITTIFTWTVFFSGVALGESNLDLAKKHLDKAHKAFLDQKYRKVAIQLKKVLKNSGGNEEIEANAFDLLEATYRERQGKRIPVDWELPKEVQYMKVGFRRQYNKMSNYTGFKISVVGLIQDPALVEQMKIVKYPDLVIVDKKRGIGHFSSWKHDGDNGFYLGRRFDSDDFDGLYRIKVKLKGQEAVKGWFISSNMASSKTPSVHTPVDGQVFQTANPEFRWDNFFSPEYQEGESRKIDTKVTNFDLKRETVWKFADYEATREKVTVGHEGIGVNSLKPGSYLFHLHYGEKKRFGPIHLGRGSRTIVGFEVK